MGQSDVIELARLVPWGILGKAVGPQESADIAGWAQDASATARG